MSEFLGYSQNGKIDKSKGFIHKSVFEGNEESFLIEDYNIVYLSKEEVDLINSSKNLEQTKVLKIAQCKAYLISTDWQVIRLSDPTSGEPLKEGVAEKRTLARSLQVNIEACTTLEELNNINIDFS